MSHLIETVYNLLWGDLFTLPVGGGIGISLMAVLLLTAGGVFTLRTPLLPAGPATRCAPPAMKRPMPPTARRLRRRRSSSTRPWKHWKRAIQARPCAPVSWASITGWLRII